VIPFYLRQARRGGTIIMHGEGTQTRDYVYIDDVVSAMLAAATAPGVNHLVINIGSGKETSIRELVRMVLELTGSPSEVITNPRTDPGVSRMCASLALARERLGYTPRISLQDGLRLTTERDPKIKR
jgi:UDP-glucose 4-epimerase